MCLTGDIFTFLFCIFQYPWVFSRIVTERCLFRVFPKARIFLVENLFTEISISDKVEAIEKIGFGRVGKVFLR